MTQTPLRGDPPFPRKGSESTLEGQFTLGETVGSGGFGKVKLAIHNLTREKCAIKIIDKEAIGEDLPRVKTELIALKKLSHQNICRLFQVVESEKKFYIIMEYCSGGELFDYIVKKQYLQEAEARHFFRQIVAALAYVHHMGFAHRDLKPENLLLTDDLQLKLIDFGLCANPESGLRNVLSTCCGSPAYAAPELIKGEPYFGNEADVWSMGVLLYALLCGFLPFEDENIQVLYNKIATGVYAEPPWLSAGSKSILKGMLQKDPKQRITIQQLLVHPWLLKRYDLPLKWRTIYDRCMIDEEVTREMARYYDKTYEEMYKEIEQWKYDDYSATYFCLLARKRRNAAILLPFPKKRLTVNKKVERNSSSLLNSPTIHASLETGMDQCHSEAVSPAFFGTKTDNEETDAYKNTKKSYVCAMENGARERTDNTPVSTKVRARMVDAYEEANKENSEVVVRSDRRISKEELDVPVAPRPKSVYATPKGPMAAPSTARDKILAAQNWAQETPLSVQLKTKSYEELDSGGGSEREESPVVTESERTPRSKTKTPSSIRRKAFASVERKLDRVKNLLTPGRRLRLQSTPNTLRRTKTLVNVSTTSSDNPELVLNELIRVFNNKGIVCEQTGWKIHGKAKDGRGRVNLTLELEVVVIESLGTVGVRRKRLNGDSFMYKRVCEDILKLASL